MNFELLFVNRGFIGGLTDWFDGSSSNGVSSVIILKSNIFEFSFDKMLYQLDSEYEFSNFADLPIYIFFAPSVNLSNSIYSKGLITIESNHSLKMISNIFYGQHLMERIPFVFINGFISNDFHCLQGNIIYGYAIQLNDGSIASCHKPETVQKIDSIDYCFKNSLGYIKTTVEDTTDIFIMDTTFNHSNSIITLNNKESIIALQNAIFINYKRQETQLINVQSLV